MLTICVRPIGEMFAIMSFDHFIWVYENRSVFNGTVMAVCVLLAYGVPFFVRRLSHSWLYAVHPFVVLVFFLQELVQCISYGGISITERLSERLCI